MGYYLNVSSDKSFMHNKTLNLNKKQNQKHIVVENVHKYAFN